MPSGCLTIWFHVTSKDLSHVIMQFRVPKDEDTFLCVIYCRKLMEPFRMPPFYCGHYFKNQNPKYLPQLYTFALITAKDRKKTQAVPVLN
jgi:hypothetical protein